MTEAEWQELESMEEDLNSVRYLELLNMTEQENEHPEEYNGPCFCRECMTLI